MKKKLIGAIGITMAAVIGCSLIGCGKSGEAQAASYVSLDINPSIELTLDDNNNVISVYGANEDGEILLYGEDGLIGVNVETAVGKITELAIEYGYLDEANKVVETTVTAKNGNKENEILNKVNAKITASASGMNLTVTTDGEGVYSLVRKYEQFKKDPPNADISLSNFKLALSASETGEVTLEAAVSLDKEELIKIVSAAHKEVKDFATVAAQKAKAVAENVYDNAVGASVDGVYAVYYGKCLLEGKHLNTFYYGAEYNVYKSLARGFNGAASCLAYVEKISEYELTDEQVSAVMVALKIEDKTLIQNSEGKVTVESVEAYADKVFKNSQAGAELEEMKAALTAALNTAEENIKNLIAKAAKEYDEQIQTLLNTVNGLIPELAKNYFSEFTAMTNELKEILKDGHVTAAKMRECADKAEKKAAEVLEKIENDLSAEELQSIKKDQENVKADLDKYKTALENAISKAKADANKKLEELKENRRQAA